MHVRGEGGRSNYPVWGDAVGSGVEPRGGSCVHVSQGDNTMPHNLVFTKD